MAKFQLCEFTRTKRAGGKNGPLKCDNRWERGIAKVKSFDDSDVEFILDENGNKVKKVWNYRLITISTYNREVLISTDY